MTAPVVDDTDLAALERAVGRALTTGDDHSLSVLGHGEISLVLGWPVDAPRWACKRLPPFPEHDAAHAYERVLHRYVDALTERGVVVVDTAVHTVVAESGAVVVYCVQPVLPTPVLGPDIVRAGGERAEELLRAIVDRAAAVVDRSVGLDAQLSNWALADSTLSYLDITTPLLRDARDVPELDTDVFLASLPWLLRAPVRRFVVPGIIDRYHRLRTVLLDVAANLVKERLDVWMPVVLGAANAHLDEPLTEAEVRSDYRSDARTWAALQAVRRADRTWQRVVRRRAYPHLLPDRIDR